MFKAACNLYYSCLCGVGGGTEECLGKLHAKGCLVSERHVLTAKHVGDQMADRYDRVVVLTWAGLFECAVVRAWPASDLAVLETTQHLASGDSIDPPTAYPPIFGCAVLPGMSVGYLGPLRRTNDAGLETTETYFADATVSFLAARPRLHSNDQPRWALSGGFCERGFSGGPVFAPDCTLVGVLTQIQQWFGTAMDGSSYPVVVPMMTPVGPIGRDLREIVSTAGNSGTDQR